MSRLIRRAATCAVLAALSLTGCVGIPASSDPVPVTTIDNDSLGDGQIQIEALAPKAGQQPDEVVRGFVAASASNARNRPVARQFLTAAASQRWADDAAVTVIGRDFATIFSNGGTQVTLTGRVVGRVDAAGVYTADNEELSLVLSMRRVDNQWRIDNPLPGVILRVDDFQRAYVQNNLYFLDVTGTKVVPDPRYFLSGSVARANTLVEALLRGPSQFLSPAVTTEFGPDVQLVSNVQEVRDLRINLHGLGQRSEASLQGLSAQLVWTLKQLSFNTLTLYDDNRVLSVPGVGTSQSSDSWPGFDPDVVPVDSVGHYIDQGAVLQADGTPIPGPAGAGDYSLVAAGTDPDQTTLAGVSVTSGGATLLLGEYGGPLGKVLTGNTLTAPAWSDPAREAWVVRNGTEVIRVPVGASPQAVSVSDVGDLGTIRALALSRDGSRAAVVAGPVGAGSLYVARITRSGPNVALSGFTPLAAALRNVVDVDWATATKLLFLATDPADGRRKPWLISVDGAVLAAQSSANLPTDPTGIAVAPGRSPLASAAGTMYQLDGDTWTTLVRGEPYFAGTAPFYPG